LTRFEKYGNIRMWGELKTSFGVGKMLYSDLRSGENDTEYGELLAIRDFRDDSEMGDFEDSPENWSHDSDSVCWDLLDENDDFLRAAGVDLEGGE
jgi:hypothetical protein